MKSRFSTMMKFVALFSSIQMGKKARNMNLLLCACCKISVQLLQNAKWFCKMQDAKCNCKIQNANDLVFKQVCRNFCQIRWFWNLKNYASIFQIVDHIHFLYQDCCYFFRWLAFFEKWREYFEYCINWKEIQPTM